tara:strand:+ start:2008 stop:3642 length:1635 start_codon:yes stop_codon:yes gene_type:complete
MTELSLKIVEYKKPIISLSLIISFGLFLRFIYFPYDIPIYTDGFFYFVYSVRTVYELGLPFGQDVTNTGWANFVSLFFLIADKTDPMHLMDVQRVLSIVLSVLTLIPAFFIFKRFVDYRIALVGCLFLGIEPRLLLLSLEGLNYTAFLFIFILSIELFLRKTNFSLIASFVCIAIGTLIRYDTILLLIPFSIIYFKRFPNKKAILRFFVIVLIMTSILAPVGMMRIQATQNICNESIWIENFGCGNDGFTQNIFFGLEVIYKSLFGIKNNSIDSDGMEVLSDEFKKPKDFQFFINIITKLVFYQLLILIPFLGFFVGLNLISRINKKEWEFSFDLKIIMIFTATMIIPAIYAYFRGFEESRYLFVTFLLLCIISISLKKSLIEKILKQKQYLILIIVIPIILSISFIEYQKDDYVYERESFKILKEITLLTKVTNTFENSKYQKTADLFNEWPELPKIIDGGKLSKSEKISTSGFDNIEDYILYSKEYGLEYILVDQKDNLFSELHENNDNYPYLELIYDSKENNFENKFQIYKINYRLMENRN